MTRPSDITEAAWAEAYRVYGRLCGFASVLSASALREAAEPIARALMAAEAREREACALLAETADRPGHNTGSLIAAAIRKRGEA